MHESNNGGRDDGGPRPASDRELGELREWIGEGCPADPGVRHARMTAIAEAAVDELLWARDLARMVAEDLRRQRERVEVMAAQLGGAT